MAQSLGARLSPLSSFSKPGHADSNDERGEKVTSSSIAGGGRGTRRIAITENQIRVSQALKSFLVHHNVLSSDVELQDLIKKPLIHVPASLTDRSHPLVDYFISSSHNTYLVAHQLFGNSCATTYERVLNARCRCVEIDAWDNDEDKFEPKVTHGYTLVSNIRFRTVCETIRDVYDRETARAVDEHGYCAAPILLSLENHCGSHGQLRLVEIMKEVWGDRLLSQAVRHESAEELEGAGGYVCLGDLGSKICVIVEHHIFHEADDSSDSDDDGFDHPSTDYNISSSSKKEALQAKRVYRAKKRAVPSIVIIPELAKLGIYAQSVKPSDNSWYESELKNAPHNHLINISESALGAHMPDANGKIAIHNSKYLMRVFPKGTRITSKNLNPILYWGLGAQICALNWQTFSSGMQLNEALFSGTDGYVLKPDALRAGGSGLLHSGRRTKLRIHIAGATNVPSPPNTSADTIKPYVTCMLMHPTHSDDALKAKTVAYRQHKLSFLHRGENPPVTEPVWDELLQWEYDDNDLVFVRILIKSDDSFARNSVLALAAIRVLYIVPEWRFIRMLNMRGEETTCTMLVKFEVTHL